MTVILLWAIRILVLMFVARYVLQLMFGQRSAPARRQPAGPMERRGGTLVRCAQCGTYVPETGVVAVSRRAGAEQFCSSACRDKWVAAKAS